MSEFAGELKVKIVPDTSGFAQELQAGVASQTKQITESQANRQAFQVQAQVANLGPLIKSIGPTAAAAGIETTRKNLMLLEQAAKQYPQLALGAAQARAQFDLLTKAEIRNAAATEAVVVANRQAARGPALAQGLRSNLLNVARGAESGQSLGQLASFGAKAGAIGLGITAAYQAVNHLRGVLQTTGQEASTTEGKFRNFGAALLGGDVIGALTSLNTQVELTTQNIADLQAQIAKGDTTKLKELAEAANFFGNDKLREQLQAAQFGVRSNLIQDQQTQAGLTPGLKDDLAAARKAEAEARSGIRVFERGTTEYTKAFTEYASAVQRRRDLQKQIESKNLSPEGKDAARGSQYDLNLLRAKRTKQTNDDVAVQTSRRDFLQKQIDVLEKNTSKTADQKQRLVSLYGQLDSVEGSLQQTRDQARQAEQERLQKRIALAQTDLQIDLVNARGVGQETAVIRQQAALASATSRDKRLSVEQQKSFELDAAQYNKQLYDIQQQQVAQAKQAAADTAAAKKQEIEAEKQRYREGLSLREQKLQLKVQEAELTKGLGDDRKRAKDLIAFYKAEQKDRKLSVQERLTARSNEVSERLKLRGLSDSGGNGQSAALTSQSFFSAAASQFNTYGSNIAGRNGVLSGQDARAQFAARALSGNGAQAFAAAVERARATQATQQLAEAQRQTALLHTIAAGVRKYGVPGPVAASIGKARGKAFVIGGH